MRSLIVIAFVGGLLALAGCSSQRPAPVDPVIIHPEIPDPVSMSDVDWVVLETDNGVIVGAPYSQFVQHIVDLEGILQYINRINNVVCFYREDQLDQPPICE